VFQCKIVLQNHCRVLSHIELTVFEVINLHHCWQVPVWISVALSFIVSFYFKALTTVLKSIKAVSVQLILGFCTPYGVTVHSAHFGLLCPRGPRGFSQWIMHWWRVHGRIEREQFPCTHPSTPSTRLDRPHVPFIKSLEWPWVSDPGYQVWWRVLNQLNHPPSRFIL